jgi:hypothetical protein
LKKVTNQLIKQLLGSRIFVFDMLDEQIREVEAQEMDL